MMESGVPLCNTCGEHVGFDSKGDIFVGCHECSFPICKACVDYEIKQGRKACMRCNTAYDDISAFEDVPVETEASSGATRPSVAAYLNNDQNGGIHARNISSVSTVDSEVNGESGNPIWKNRVASWRDKKDKKKKPQKKAVMEAEAPTDQHMEEKMPTEALQPLSRMVPIPRTKIAPYRMVIIMRLIILALFFHYRITNPVDSAYGLWLTSVICEIWFAVSWVLDQFPKWYPVCREAYTDQLSLRYEREGEPSQLAAVDFFVSTVDPLKEPPLITSNTVLSILAVDYSVDKLH